MRFFEGKKAQITIFIIIGIVLLFSSALIMYIKNTVTNTTPPPTVIQNVPEDLTGMKKYIEDCVFSTGKTAVQLIGEHGGYIYPQNFSITSNPIRPTEATGVEMMSGSGIVVPYWYYLKSPNNCKGNCMFSTKTPPLTGNDPDSIESQISSYVSSNFKSCLNNFDAYQSMGYTVREEGKPITKTTVTMDEVVIDVTWPIEAGRQDEKLKKIDKFVVTLPVNLKQAYDFAADFVAKESENSYIETNVLNLIAYYSDRNKDQLPPMADYSFIADNTRIWTLDDVRNKFSNVMFLYTPMLRIRNSLNGQGFAYVDDMTQNIMDKTIIDLNDSERHPLAVDFRYSLTWPMYFDVTPRSGYMIEPKSVMGGFGVLGLMNIDMKQYQFQYDISYPLIITLSDPTAFNNEGYSFAFAMESNIRNNRPLNHTFNPLAISDSANTFVCDEQQKKSGEITIKTYDDMTGKPLEGVSVIYSFGNKGCEMGLTLKLNNTNETVLIDKFPTGLGSLTFKKIGYETQTIPMFGTKEGSNQFVTNDGKNDTLKISLYPQLLRNVSLKVYSVDKDWITVNTSEENYTYCSDIWKFNNISKDIRKNQSVTVTLIKVVNDESPETRFIPLEFNDSAGGISQTLSIGPGKYELRISSMMNELITFPERKVTYGSGRKKVTITYDTITLESPYQDGVLEFNNETGGYFEVKPEDLYNSASIEFHALIYNLKESCNLVNPDEIGMSFDPDASKNMLSSKRRYLEPSFK